MKNIGLYILQDRHKGTKEIDFENEVAGFSTGDYNYKTRRISIQKSGIFTSFDDFFHHIMNGIISAYKIPHTANNILIKIIGNKKAQIFIDNFSVQAIALLDAKSQKSPGDNIYQGELVDIRSATLLDEENNDITPKDGDKFIWIFRNNFSFGLYFDLTGNAVGDNISRNMGYLISLLNFTNSYRTFNPRIFKIFIRHGWFPFVDLAQGDIAIIAKRINVIPKKWLKDRFNESWTRSISKKWFSKQYFKAKEKTIMQGLECFIRGEYIASCSTLLPCIEGLISEAYKSENSKEMGFKDKDIKDYLENKTKDNQFNKLSPVHFLEYLTKHVYKHGMNKKNLKRPNRHTQTHSRSPESSYSIENTVQIILTINQLYYYL